MKSINAARGFAVAAVPLTFRLALFHGSDEAASTDLARQLTARLAPNIDDIVALSPTQLKEDPARLGDEAAAVSMFSSLRVLRIDNAGDESLEALSLLLDLPAAANPTIVTAGNLRKTSKLLQLVEAAPDALVVQSYDPSEQDTKRYVDQVAAEFGLTVTRDAASRLNVATNQDRGLIRQELGKCALYLNATPEQPQTLDAAHLLEIGADVTDESYDALVLSITGGRPRETDRQLARMTAGGISAIPVLRALSRRLWQLFDLRTAVDGGAAPDAAIEAARPPVFWKDKPALKAEVTIWRPTALHQALDRLLAAERAVKSKGAAGDVLATQALLGIAVLASRNA